MRLLFCSDPIDQSLPEPSFHREVSAARSLDLQFDLLDHDVPDRPKRPLEHEDLTIYRGWMLRTEHYARMYESLATSGRTLINSPAQYEHCHHLPASYDVIRDHTPRTVWLPTTGDFSIDEVMALLAPFANAPLILKDFVKSQKHAWLEACFIPDASDRVQVESVARRFVELQGKDLVGGLVFREFIDLEQVGVHPKSGLPLSRELRLFFADGKRVQTFKYWDEGDYGAIEVDLSQFDALATKVRSRFFSMDVARTKSGQWIVVELGDGQVTGLPASADPRGLFRALVDVST